MFLQVRISGTEVKFFPASLLSGSDDMGTSCDVVMLLCPPIVLSLESSFTDSDSLRSSIRQFLIKIRRGDYRLAIDLLFTSWPSVISVTA